MNRKLNQSGFSPVVLIVVLVVLLVLGGVGYYVWRENKPASEKQTSVTPGALQQKPPTDNEVPEKNQLVLADGEVSFVLPEKWTAKQASDLCHAGVTAEVTCIEGAEVTPGENLPTRYGDGTEYFKFHISVFDNSSNTGPQSWHQNVMQEGIGSGQVTRSNEKVNDYSTYHMTQQYKGDGTTVREVTYVFTAKQKAVVVVARTYEPGVLSNGERVGDFRKFEPEIIAAAKTVTIK